MDEITKALERHKKRCQTLENEPQNFKISHEFTKILLSVIFLLSSVIFMKLDTNNKEIYKKYFFENNLMFTKINTWYRKNFGNILPTVKEPSETTVSKATNFLEKENYQNGYKIKSSKESPVTSIASGLLVFMGDKEGYGNTLIIQGVDGTDIWYGNIKDVNLKLYDYVEAGSILGNTTDDFYYLVLQKEGNYVTYEDYQNSLQA